MTRDVDASDLMKNSKCRVVIANPRHPCNLLNTQEKSKKKRTTEDHHKRKINIVTRQESVKKKN